MNELCNIKYIVYDNNDYHKCILDIFIVSINPHEIFET